MADEPDYAAQLQDQSDSFNIVRKPVETRESGSQEDRLAEARERACIAAERWEDNFDAAADDVRFSAGIDQWDAYAREARGDEPCLTFNTLPQFIDQITGQMRQQRPSIHVNPADDHASEIEFAAGKAKRKMKGAEVYEGIIRAIEYRSNAEAHYDTAAEHAVDGGFGWLRVRPQFASRATFDQELLISHVRDRWACLVDPDAVEPDMSDARYAFVFGYMPAKEFDLRYPDKRRGELGTLGERERKVWMTTSAEVGVAEYMWREGKDRVLLLLSNGQIGWEDDLTALLPGLAQNGVTVARARKVLDWSVYWELISSHDVLEKRVKLPFTTIPLVPVLGKTKHLRGGETLFRSAIRDAKEPKQAENYWLSAATSRVALAPRAVWVADADAVEGYEAQWESANRAGGSSLLRFNTGSQPPTREMPPAMPVAEIQMAAIMVDHVKATIGIYDASIGAESNEKSGRAILARQNQSNNSTFAFTDNLNRAIRRVGLLLVEAIPKIYDADRIMRLRGEDGSDDWVRVNQVEAVIGPDGQPMMEPVMVGEKPLLGPDGAPVMRPVEVVLNPLGSGEFDVVVKAGPSYSTQRQEAAEAQMELVTAVPDLAPVMMDVMVENMDWPQAGKLAKRIRSQMDPKLLTKQEREDLEEEPEVDPETGEPVEEAPDPAQEEAAALQAQAMEVEAKSVEADMITAEAKFIKAEADMILAKLAKAQAQQQAAVMGMPLDVGAPAEPSPEMMQDPMAPPPPADPMTGAPL